MLRGASIAPVEEIECDCIADADQVSHRCRFVLRTSSIRTTSGSPCSSPGSSLHTAQSEEPVKGPQSVFAVSCVAGSS